MGGQAGCSRRWSKCQSFCWVIVTSCLVWGGRWFKMAGEQTWIGNHWEERIFEVGGTILTCMEHASQHTVSSASLGVLLHQGETPSRKLAAVPMGLLGCTLPLEAVKNQVDMSSWRLFYADWGSRLGSGILQCPSSCPAPKMPSTCHLPVHVHAPV